MHKILSINTSARKGVAKKPVGECLLVEGFGIEGDAHGDRLSDRQVSLLAAEAVNLMKEEAGDLVSDGAFGENLDLEGLGSFALKPGDILRFSGGAELQVTRIGKNCHAPCVIHRTTGRCIMPVQGVFCRVIKGGSLETGAEYSVIEAGALQAV